MSLARSVLLRAARSRWLADQLTRRAFARRAVARFMPGERLDDALGAARKLANEGIGSIVTRLGESLTGESRPDDVCEHYLDAYDRIQRDSLPVVVSVKPTQLGIDRSYEACLVHLERLAQKAVDTGSQLWIDMEDSSYVDRTLSLYRCLRSVHEPVGIAIQAYLRRTPRDIDELLTLKPMIRLVKGAYAEPPQVAYPAKRDVDGQYLAIGARLLEAARLQQAVPIFGTHDMSIVRQLVAKASSLGLPPSAYQIHMLFGIRAADQRALAAQGHVVRCLISYGEQWFPWYMRRLAERPANVWFVARSILMK
jgi:proline dehydrogenase